MRLYNKDKARTYLNWNAVYFKIYLRRIIFYRIAFWSWRRFSTLSFKLFTSLIKEISDTTTATMIKERLSFKPHRALRQQQQQQHLQQLLHFLSLFRHAIILWLKYWDTFKKVFFILSFFLAIYCCKWNALGLWWNGYCQLSHEVMIWNKLWFLSQFPFFFSLSTSFSLFLSLSPSLFLFLSLSLSHTLTLSVLFLSFLLGIS